MRSVIASALLFFFFLSTSLFADGGITFSPQVIDPDPGFSSEPLGFADSRRILIATADHSKPAVYSYSVREADGTTKTVSELTGISDKPIDMNADGEILFSTKLNDLNTCSVNIFTRNRELKNIQLPAGLPCRTPSEAKLGKNLNFALILEEDPANGIPAPQFLLLYSNGNFNMKSYEGSSSGFMDFPADLAGFRGDEIVTNEVSGGVTTSYENILFSIADGKKTLTNDARLPPASPVVKGYAGKDAVLLKLHESCSTYVVKLRKEKLLNFKRIREAGECVFAYDINGKAEVIGTSSSPFLWTRTNRLQFLKNMLKPKQKLDWGDITPRFINKKGDIVAVLSKYNSEFDEVISKIVLLKRNK